MPVSGYIQGWPLYGSVFKTCELGKSSFVINELRSLVKHLLAIDRFVTRAFLPRIEKKISLFDKWEFGMHR